MSTKPLTTAPTSEWKWEVNHDGVIWSWSHPTFPPAPAALPPVALPPAPVPLAASSKKSLIAKKSLIDYWYAIHDGIALPWSGEF